jgi:DNA-directed RNA polymerase subunit beta'
MVLTVLPVIPPELRPMVQLDGGRFATSDLNDLYRRVINRNNRLKRLLELEAPSIIVRNEKRMLQEAVDSLIDNGRRGRAVSGSRNHRLRSLSDMLRGKQGRFRQNLLGKRVDYSGRSVIVIGPELKLHQCGLPKRMALELFKPFVMRKLVEHNYAHNIKSAKRIVERARPEVWDVLEEVTKDHPVLLNRAPTLHRLGIQAFEPVLVEGSAIQIHPLVCSAFNADFDGDQMAVHVPLSEAAKEEARVLMLSSRNLLLPSDGSPTIGPTKDMVLGCYYMTLERPGAKGEGKVFADFDEVLMAYQVKVMDIQASIRVRRNGGLLQTTVGRVIFNMNLPAELQFRNKVMDRKELRDLVADCYALFGPERTAQVADDIKALGFYYATRSGTTIAIGDMSVPEDKARILAETTTRVEQIERHYRRGLITEDEKYAQTVEAWTSATEEITKAVVDHLDPFGPVHMMAVSGATKGQFQQLRQISGMRGLMADPSGRIIDLPIRSNFREGLSVLEYFISTHGGRKGLADTALRTADSGYLTRRLVDVAQDVIIRVEDCGTEQGLWLRTSDAQGLGASLPERVLGRWAAAPVVDPATGEIIVDIRQELKEDAVERIVAAGVQEVYVRSPLTCEMQHGLCQFCYGRDLARGELVPFGEAVGVIAAESIGEPGTQLTMRTFHTGGVAGTEDITQGLPRVEELFESRTPKGQAIISDIEGVVDIRRDGDARAVSVTSSEIFRDEYPIPRGYRHLVTEGVQVEAGQVLAQWVQKGEVVKEIVSSMAGQIHVAEESAYVRTAESQEVPHDVPIGYKRLVEDGAQVQPGQILAQRVQEGQVRGEVVASVGGWFHREPERIVVYHEERETRGYELPPAARLRVQTGDRVQAGDQITEGPKSPREVLRIQGKEAVQIYLVNEIQGVYRSQGVHINDKHIEIIVRQMLRKVQIETSGDTNLLPGELADRFRYEEINAKTMVEGGEPATAQTVLLGVTKAALSTDSFLSAASFQETTRVLTEAAIQGKTDRLRGLKENVIIGKLIPAGSGVRRISPHLPSPAEMKALKEARQQVLLGAFGETEETVEDEESLVAGIGFEAEEPAVAEGEDVDTYDDLLNEASDAVDEEE